MRLIDRIVDSIKAAVFYFCAIIEVGVAVAVLVFVLFLLGANYKPARAEPAIIKTPDACHQLAKHFGFTASPTYTAEEAKFALSHLGLRMVLVREARACRSAIKRELAR